MVGLSRSGTKDEHSGVRQEFEAFQRRTFPEAGESPELIDWLADFAEVDGYYAGLISSALAGTKVDLDTAQLNAMLLRLSEIANGVTQADKAALEYSKRYAEDLLHLALSTRRAIDADRS